MVSLHQRAGRTDLTPRGGQAKSPQGDRLFFPKRLTQGDKQVNTSIKTSAVSAAPSEWHQIDWARTHGTVRRLQARMVKATEARDWRRVKALQRFLVRSFSGKALAVRRVTENQGRRTPGVDGDWE